MRSALQSVPGVKLAKVTLEDSLAVVRYEPTVALNDLIQAVEEAGYGAKVTSGPAEIAASSEGLSPKAGSEEKAPSRKQAVSLSELERTLTRRPYQGKDAQLRIELTLVTPDYLNALYEMERAAQDTTLEFSAYKKTYRIAEAVPFRVTMETHTVNTSPFDLKEAALLIDAQGKEYPALGWQELPSPVPAMPYHHRRGILYFPKVAPAEIRAEMQSFEVVLRGIGSVKERRFRWVFSEE